MAPADLLRPLEGQREDTLQVLDSIAEDDLENLTIKFDFSMFRAWDILSYMGHEVAADNAQ